MQSKPTALGYALRLLSLRGRSELELAERLLKKGYSKDEISKAIERLNTLGYINDTALAESLVRSAMEVKLLGRFGANRFLGRRGIGRTVIESALSDYDEDVSARRLIEKRLRAMPANLSDEVKKKRLFGALARRGFSMTTIYKVMKISEED